MAKDQEDENHERTWLEKATDWDMLVQVLFIIVMLIIGGVLFTLESCRG